MSDQRTRRINRVEAERLLDGHPGTGVSALLAARLRAASAPAHPDELAGERAALSAFQAAAQLDPNPRQRRPSMLKIALAKLLTVKAAAAAAAVTAGAGGIALAAGTGLLPIELPTGPASPSGTHAPASPGEQSSSDGNGGDPAGHPSPSMVGLCQAFAAEVGNDPGKALESPAFQALITAAGGADKVDGFCQTQAAGTKGNGSAPSNAPGDIPTPSAGAGNAEQGTSHAPTQPSRPEPPAGSPTAIPTGGSNG